MGERTTIALLRGINVGGHHRVPMADVRDLATSLGFGTPVTYIQSGNLVFDTDLPEAAVVAALESALEDRLGFQIPVVARTSSDLLAVAQAHPLAGPDSSPRSLMVAFLDQAPAAEIEEVIDPKAFEPDRFLLMGREVYLHYPNGSGRSPLSQTLLEDRLGVRATIRNWNTITRLVELAQR